MDLREQFESAAERLHSLPRRPSNDVLLKLYGLYKQATEGDVQGDRPGGFDLKGAAKYDAWAAQKGKVQETAMQEYVSLAEGLLQE
jgi:diazepam-binding inhibitor (GABA receptor modulator, acyl-CoA-binding protein)